MAINKVGTKGIADGAVAQADFADNAVTSDKLQNGAVSNAKLSNTTITLAGESITLGASASLTNKFVDWQSVITADGSTFNTAVSGQGYFIDTTSAVHTINLPASASRGDFIAIKDYAGTFNTNNLTIGRNGHNIQGVANNSLITTNRASLVLVYVDSTKGWLYWEEHNVADLRQVLFTSATGGTVTTSGDYKIHTFTGNGTFCVSCAGNTLGNNSLNYLIVAGGGGSGGYGAGGAGGLRTLSGTLSSAGGYPITVGAGGNCSSPGNNTVFLCSTSAGGGTVTGGIAAAGGSGAGGCYYTLNPQYLGGAGNTPPVSPSQGNPGGNGAFVQCSAYGGGGGGGHTSAGSNATAPPGNAQGGSGGAGTNVSPLFPSFSLPNSGVYAGGGGGGTANAFGCSGTPGTGGTGGGGPGGTFSTPGTNGTTNTGGGGGGRNTSGGSGIVIIRYKFQ